MKICKDWSDVVATTGPRGGGAEIARPDNARPDNAAPVKTDRSGLNIRQPKKKSNVLTISELNPVCHDSTAALVVACSFCVQSAILLAKSLQQRVDNSSNSNSSEDEDENRQAPYRQQRQLQGRRNRQQQQRQQPRTTVAKCASWRYVLASHW